MQIAKWYIKMCPWQEVEWGICLMHPYVFLWSEMLKYYIKGLFVQVPSTLFCQVLLLLSDL